MLQVFEELNKKEEQKNIILFSPSAASFDQFKNFQIRGEVFKSEVNAIKQKYLGKTK